MSFRVLVWSWGWTFNHVQCKRPRWYSEPKTLWSWTVADWFTSILQCIVFWSSYFAEINSKGKFRNLELISIIFIELSRQLQFYGERALPNFLADGSLVLKGVILQ